jgi:hypothetical protein
VDEHTFWELVGTVGRHPDDEAYARLTELLAGRAAADITGFADHLARALYALDTPAHARAVNATDDWNLYVRCAVVATGEKQYRKVLAKPKAIRGFADEEAELLLTVAEEAFERSTGQLWEHEPPVDYEMGSNTAAWGTTAPEPTEPYRHPGWLLPMVGCDLDGPPHAYIVAFHHVLEALGTDPAWQQWWSASGVPLCELDLFFGARDQRPTRIKRGRGKVRAQVGRAAPAVAGADEPTLVATATADLLALLGEIGGALDLPALPAVPKLGPMPSVAVEDDLDVLDTGDLQALLQLGETQGHITLDQIRRYLPGRDA